MSRPHALTLALGFVLGLVVLVSMGQVSVAPVNIARVEYYARPQDMVQIRQGVPYAVPAGKLFVLTALGTNLATPNDHGEARLFVDGQRSCSMPVTTNSSQTPSISSIAPVPLGPTFSAGSVLTVVASDPWLSARAWGYLSSESPRDQTGGNLIRIQYEPHPSAIIQMVIFTG